MTEENRPSAYLEPDQLAQVMESHMDAIMQLLEAMAAEQPDTDMALAELLEGETEQVRVAIIEKLRALLRGLAAEKEKELDQYLDKDKRVEIERQRNIFLQWLQWIMSEETLRKIREAFLARPQLEREVMDIGHDLAAKGVLNQMKPGEGKRALGELSANIQQPSTGRDLGKGGRGA